MKNVATIVACFAVFLVFSGCNKEENTPVWLLESISTDDVPDYTFEYDTHDRLTKIVRYIDGELVESRSFWYNEDDELVKTNGIRYHFSGTEYGHSETTYVKKNNRIYSNYIDGVLADYPYIELNSAGFPVRFFLYSNEGTNYNYDKNGNLIEMKSFIGSTGSTCTYDNNKSPFFSCKTPKWVLLHQLLLSVDIVNNKITENSYGGGNGDYNRIFTYTYDDKEGFPLTSRGRRWVYPPDETEVTYKYIKK